MSKLYPELGVNQIRLLHALHDGEFKGKLKGPRPAIDFINLDLPWVRRKQGGKRLERSRDIATQRRRTSAALRSLERRGYIKVTRRAVRGMIRSHVKITQAGMDVYKYHTDPYYRKLRVEEEARRAARKKATYFRWNRQTGQTILWERWYARSPRPHTGWRVLIQNHPVNGWEVKMIRPDGAETDWTKSTGNTVGDAKRDAESTWRSLVGEYSEATGAPESA